MKTNLALLFFLFFTALVSGNEDTRALASTLQKEAFEALKDKRYEPARAKFQQLANSYPDSAELRGLCFNNLGAIDLIEGLNSRAIQYIEQALNEYKKSKKDTLIAICLYNNGLVYKRLAQYDKATESLLKAIRLFEQNDRIVDLSKTYNVLGNLFKSTNDFEKALTYHNKAVDNSILLNDSLLLAKFLNNRGITYMEMEFYDEALKDLKQSLLIKQDKDVLKSSAYTLYNLGEVEYLRGKSDKAEIYFLKSLRIHRHFDNKPELAYCFNQLGRIYKDQKRWELATLYLDSALDQAVTNEIIDLQIRNYLFQSELYEEKKQWDKALLYSKRYVDLYKTVLNKDKQESIKKLQIEYEVEKIENQNLLLEQEAEINTLRIKSQENALLNWKIISVSISLLLILITFLGYRFYQLSKREKQLALKEKQMNIEQHHRIKNHLQVLGGLLSFQQRKLEDEGAKEAIQESKNRVAAISMLHRHLYQNEDLSSSSIQLNTYLEAIILQLMSINAHQKVHLEKNLNAVLIDADRALPLGLICNEIIGNAFKHGLKKKNAVLTIHLFEKDDHIYLNIKDNGNWDNQISSKASVGLELIEQMAKQIDAEVIKEHEDGTSYRLILKQKKGGL